MCISDLFQGNHPLVLVGMLGGGLILALIAASIGMHELRSYFTRNFSDNSAPPQEEDRDLNIISDDTYVEQLLLNHAGKLYQREIVTETGWSKSKVSVLLSDMEANDLLTKIRLGRENLIVLPGYEPEHLTSARDPDREHGWPFKSGE
jgi:uncharacterized membrane protein